MDIAESHLGECNLDCYEYYGDSSEWVCHYECSVDFIDDYENCPCQKGCPNGCPCDQYKECLREDQELSVLVLQHGGGDNKLDPFIIDFYGNVNTDTDFSFEENTDINGACSVIYREKAYIFGGVFNPRQVSICNSPFMIEIVFIYIHRSVMFVHVSCIEMFKLFQSIFDMDRLNSGVIIHSSRCSSETSSYSIFLVFEST